MPEVLLLKFSFLLFIFGAIFALALNFFSKKLSIISSAAIGIIASGLSLVSSVLILLHKSTLTFSFYFVKPFGPLELLIDPLAAFFILLISILSIPVLIYSIGYLQAEYMEKNIGIMGVLYHLFILSMVLVVCAANAFLFLFLWELMTLISFIFVVSDAKNPESGKAGFIYLLMTHIGLAFLLFAFLIFAKYSGDFSFSSFQSVSHEMSYKIKFLLFGFLLIGFGTKAGLIPLHIWLPEAHPAAPSHISALMSGVMIKTAVYGILRFIFDFLSPFPYWWGLILAVFAIVTAMLGIIYASLESDLKRMLAFSSIENMGIILLPVGIGMIFFAVGQKGIASLCIVAALFHSINHCLFKGLLFMCAGSVISVTHTRNMEKLGGLIKLMPQTSILFLIGSLAISALPPFNGFLSEWFIYQVLLSSFQVHSQAVKVFAPVCGALLGFTGAICAATFVKAFSSIFLALPRSHQPLHAHGVSLSMRIGMGLPAVLCLFIGIMPFIIIPLLQSASEAVTGVGIQSDLFSANSLVINFGTNYFAAVAPGLIFALLIAFIITFYFVSNIIGNKMPVRKDETWSCGVTPKAEFEHTPSGYSQPFGVIFKEMYTPESFYYKYIYLPVANGLINISHRAKPIQSGNLQLYLAYIFITLILCLVWLRL